MDEDGNLLARSERGEIVVRSSLVMPGYYRNPEATAEASAHGWHHTGDIGYLDDDDFLFIVDRAKDMVITGGFNVYSTEVEQALMQHPAVQDCAVVGLPDEKWGERVTAVVQLRPSREPTGRADGVRQGADRQRQGAQAGRGLGGPAALEGRQGAQDRHPAPLVAGAPSLLARSNTGWGCTAQRQRAHGQRHHDAHLVDQPAGPMPVAGHVSLSSAAWNSPSRTLYAEAGSIATSRSASSEYRVTIRQIMSPDGRVDRQHGVAEPLASNMLWTRRSYQSRCMGASSTIVSTSLAANPSISSCSVVDSSMTGS